jgi:hypothetical protein
MKLKRLAVVLVVAGLALAFYGFSGSVSAATTGNAIVTFTIPTHQTLTITGAPVNFSSVTLDVPTAAQTVVVTVKSNVPYTLTYTAPDEFTSGSTSTVVPIGRLTYGGTSFESGTKTLVTAPARTTGAGDIYNYSYVLTVLFDDADPGSFTGTVIYTVSP